MRGEVDGLQKLVQERIIVNESQFDGLLSFT